MTDSRANLPYGLSIADLDRFERTLRETEGVDLTEAKEGVVDGLLGLALNQCSGAGPEGAVLYAAKPSAQLVSGFLRPRFNQDGDDETSDIRIATIGMDLQLAAEATGTIEVVPELAIYVRVLPSWSEISDARHDMMPQVQLSRATRQQVDALAQTYVNAALAELDPVSDVEPDERSGDATAAADTARERADIAADEAASGDADARGTAQAAAQAADRAERDAATLAARQVQRRASQQRRQESVSAIRRAAYERAFRELGIQITTPDGSRPITPSDLEDPEASDAAALDDAEAPPVGPEGGDEEADDDGPPPATGTLGPLRPEIGRLEDRHAAPQPIPQKWRRFATIHAQDCRPKPRDRPMVSENMCFTTRGSRQLPTKMCRSNPALGMSANAESCRPAWAKRLAGKRPRIRRSTCRSARSKAPSFTSRKAAS